MFPSGASGLHLTKHENFHGGLDAISVGDGLFTILTTLSKKASSVQVMLQPILTYMACGYMGRQVSISLRSVISSGVLMCHTNLISAVCLFACSVFLKPFKGCLSTCQLSEPLLWFILRVLDTSEALKAFHDMGRFYKHKV